MGSNKFTIIHFQPLELYPPVVNFINCLQNHKDIDCTILSTKWKYNLDIKYPCFRLGFVTKNKFVRIFNYFYFNLVGCIILFVKRPQSIMYFETLSVFPAYVYKKVFVKTRVLVHFHEYTTLDEYSRSSRYYKYLHSCESKLLNSATVVSHTNEDRLKLYKSDFLDAINLNLFVLPNYPPSSWYKNFDLKRPSADIIQFVYVGSINLDSLHLDIFAKYIKGLQKLAVWNIYSNHYDNKVLQYFKNLEADNIILNNGIHYADLPLTLSKYHVGVILYKGILPNHIYCVPNKLLEYYSCGLKVLCSSDLISSMKFIDNNKLKSVISIDFMDKDAVSNITEYLNDARSDLYKYECDPVYESYIKSYITE